MKKKKVKYVTKPMIVMRLLWESKDNNYDKDTRKTFAKIFTIVSKLPNKALLKILNMNYEFYLGFCNARDIKDVLTDTEFEILIATVDRIGSNYYDKL